MYLNRKMSATALRDNEGCLEDISAVIDACPSCSESCASCLNFDVYYLFSGQSVLWDQRDTACLLFLTSLFSYSEIAVMH